MAKKKEQKRIFNLLKPVGQPKNTWDRVYDWLIGKARVVVFVVELLIVVAFVAKFIVDTQAKNKDKRIEQLKTEESFYALQKEPAFRLIQTKTTNYIQLWNDSSDKHNILTQIYSVLPDTVEDLMVNVRDDRVVVTGYDDLNELRKLEATFKSSPTFKEAYIDDLYLEPEDISEEKGRYQLVGIFKDEFKTRKDL